MLVHLLVLFADADHEPAQLAQVRLAAVHLFFQDHVVEAFARRFGEESYKRGLAGFCAYY